MLFKHKNSAKENECFLIQFGANSTTRFYEAKRKVVPISKFLIGIKIIRSSFL